MLLLRMQCRTLGDKLQLLVVRVLKCCLPDLGAPSASAAGSANQGSFKLDTRLYVFKHFVSWPTSERI